MTKLITNEGLYFVSFYSRIRSLGATKQSIKSNKKAKPRYCLNISTICQISVLDWPIVLTKLLTEPSSPVIDLEIPSQNTTLGCLSGEAIMYHKYIMVYVQCTHQI